MKSIYNENHTNSTDTTNKNEKETEMEAFQKLANENFWKRGKKIISKEMSNGGNNNNGNNNYIIILGDSIVKKLNGYLTTKKLDTNIWSKYVRFQGQRLTVWQTMWNQHCEK